MSRSNPLNSFIRTRCGASGPRGDGAGPTAPGARRCLLNLSVRCHEGSAFFYAERFAAFAAVLPQGMPPRMRCATFNVDLQHQYFESRKQQYNKDIAELLKMVDVLALQEVGGWDSPLDKEPSRRSTVGRSGPQSGLET